VLYPLKLQQGTLIKRYKRFLADIELESGEMVTAHCANTGAMTGCAEPGWQVWLSPSTNPKRKLTYSWELVQTAQGHWISINTHKANELVAEALAHKQIAELAVYSRFQREVKFGNENSRVDFLLSGEHQVSDFTSTRARLVSRCSDVKRAKASA
jgi:sugar fermentation stimulation protein A